MQGFLIGSTCEGQDQVLWMFSEFYIVNLQLLLTMDAALSRGLLS